MLGLKLYLYNSTVEVVSNFNDVIVKHELCILLTNNYVVTVLQYNNNDDEIFLF